MSVATALARARVRSMTTISRATPRIASANTQAAPTAPAPMTPTFICASRSACLVTGSGAASELLQQPIDVVALDLGPAALAGAAAQLVEDALGLLDGVIAVGAVAHAHAAAVVDAAIGVVLRVEPAERVAVGLALTLTLAGLAAVGLAVAGLPHHLLGHAARRLLQLVERIGLRADGVAGLAALQRVGRAAHGALGAAQRLRDIAGLLAPLPHHLAELAAQRILLAGHVAIARLAAHLRLTVLAGLPPLTLSPLLTLLALLALLLLALLPLPRLAEAVVEQLLLAAHHLLHLPHRLPLAALHLARAGHLQVFQHLLELRQHVARGVA